MLKASSRTDNRFDSFAHPQSPLVGFFPLRERRLLNVFRSSQGERSISRNSQKLQKQLVASRTEFARFHGTDSNSGFLSTRLWGR